MHHIQPRLASLLLVLISSTSALAAGEGILPLLIGPQQPPFGPSGILGPAQVATGDFNRDGKTDLVVLETTTGQVRVFNGDGAGSFTMPGRIYPVSHPYAVTVTDFDGDGNLDIAITSYVENCVTILLGDGAGNFTRPSWGTLETGRRPLAIASADFNGDRRPDLAVSNYDDGSVTIFLWSASAGRFHQAAGGAFRVGTSAYRLVAADFDGDGRADLAIADPEDRAVGIWRGLGDGTFVQAAGSPVAVASVPHSLATADFNGDGRMDIAVLGDDLRVLFSSAAGGFLLSNAIPTGGTTPRSMVAEDFDADGRIDLAVTNGQPGNVALLLGGGPAGFSTPVTYLAGSLPGVFAVADLNGDGRPDLAVLSYEGIQVLLGAAPRSTMVSGTPGGGAQSATVAGRQIQPANALTPRTQPNATATTVSLVASPNPATYGRPVSLTATVTAGATGKVTFYDGIAVLGVAVVSGGTATLSTTLLSSGNRKLRAYYGGDATYAASSSSAMGQTVNAVASNVLVPAGLLTGAALYATSVATGDLNGDGKSDLVLVSSAGLFAMLGNGDGSFLNPIHTAAGGGGFTPHQVALADFNGDGRLDVAVVKQNPNSIVILMGNGNGAFQAPASYATAGVPRSVIVSDLNRDGKADLAVIDDNNVYIFWGTGDGGFRPPIQYATMGIGEDLGIGDFDGDGNPDLVVTDPYLAGIMIRLGNGDGTFRAPVVYPFQYTGVMAIGDFNGDGRDDLAVAYGDGTVSGVKLLLSSSDGTFLPAAFYGLGRFVSSIVAGDFNGDGKLDLAAVNEMGNSLSVLPGNGDGTFGAAMVYPAGTDPRSIAAGDFNGDGRADIAIADMCLDGSACVTILRGISATVAAVGSSQSAPLGMNFASPLQVIVRDAGGNPLSGVTVTFSAPLSGASAVLSSATTVTNSSGVAGVSATANNTPGSFAVVAAAGAMTASIPLVNTVATPASLTAFAGTPQSAGTGMPFPSALQILLKDSSGQPVSGASIGFAAPASGAGAVLSSVSAVTDASGLAQVFATANNTAGSYSVVASIGALSTAFALTNLPASSVFLSSWPNPSILGRAVTLTAILPVGAGGKVTFYDGTAVLGVSGVAAQLASLSTLMLPSGARSLRAYYSGDASHPAGISNTVSQAVNAVGIGALTAGAAYTIPGTFSPGYYPNFVTVADFNSDGKLDLAVANSNTPTTGSVTVLLGNGDGTFQAGINTSLNGYPISLAVGDFDGDGKADLALAMPDSNGVTILTGNGNGTFRVGVSYVTGRGPFMVKTGDFNRDGYTDLVVTNYQESTVSVLLGKGDGTFRQAVSYNSAALHSQSVEVADFNQDGIPDLAIGTDSTLISVLLGNGDGSFQSARTYSAAPFAITAATTVLAGDFNGDGRMDLAAVGVYCWSILLGNGDGSFQAPLFSMYPDWTNNPVIGDFNADGYLDLGFGYGNSGEQGIAILFGNGHGTFQAPATFPGSSTICSAAAAEFNGDGRADLVMVDWPNRAVRLMLGAVPVLSVSVTHAWTFFQGQSGTTYSIAVNNYQSVATAGTVTVTDTIPAGLTAIAIAGEGWNCTLATTACTRSDSLAPGGTYPAITVTVDVAYNAPAQVVNQVTVSGGGTAPASATDPTSITVPNRGTITTLITSPSPSNLGQDVTLSAAVSGGQVLGKVTFYDGVTIVGVAALDFLSHVATLTTNLLPAGPRSLHAHYGGDGLNAPSTSDSITHTVRAAMSPGLSPGGGYGVTGTAYSVAVGDFDRNGTADIAVANGSGVSVLLGNGDGTFQQPVNYSANTAAKFVTLGDFNGDGKTDMVTANPANNNISVFLGNGDGSFQPAVNYPSSSGPTAVAVGDLNLDGATDLVVTNSATNTVSIFLGSSNGTFRILVTYPVGSNPYSVAIADFNGDSKPDLAVTGWGGTVSVLLGNGNGTFQAATTVSGGSNTVFAASADFNGDGKADLALANQFGSNISVLLGRGDGTFLPPVYCTVSSKPVSLTAGDFNGDGILDLAVGSSADGVILLLGNGNGTFRPGTGYSAGTSAASIGVGDFNRDGKTDLAIAIGNGPANLSGVRVSAASRDRATAGTDNVLIFQGGAGAALSASVAHTGVFVRGQTGAAFNITIANLGSAASSGAVTAVETLSAGLTATNITGTGWMCTLGTLTCTRSDALAPNSSYPAITVTVSVGSAANSPFVDTVFASGGGSGSTNATDSVTAGSCGYQLSGTNAYGSPAASGAVAIASIAGCSWSAATATSWIHLTSTTSGSGSGQVNYTIDANVAAQRSGTITVAGQAFTILQGPYVNPSGVGLRFVPVSPCRIADTRNASGPLGGPSLAAATPRNFDVRASACGIPSDAQAYSINLTVVPLGILGYLSVWPAGQPQPLVSTLNSLDGRIKANAAIVPAGTSGAITLYATDPTHAIIDINGYFVAAAGNNNLAFYPISPCRIADTRGSAGILSGPALSSMVERSFPVRSSACGVPASAQAYAMNMTVVPTSMLGFLSAWPTGSPRPNASILNALTGAITANAAIVPAGTNGDISLFATDNTQVIIDINGYFAPPGAGGMQFYSATPCRILDTRSTVGPLGGPQLAAAEQRDFSVTASTCGIPTNAGAYSLNATVVPPAALGFLSLWGSGAQPNVSTLNALDGTIVANAAIVPASSTGTVTAIVTDATQLILDINGYFAQ